MAWVRIDDQFADHPKLLRAGILATALQLRALCYCSRHLTDGHLPTHQVGALLAGLDGLWVGRKRASSIDWAAHMVACGLWEVCDGGYNIHDYLVYNPTKMDVLSRRAIRQASGRAGGLAKAKASAVAGAVAKSYQTGTNMVVAKPCPVPFPSPSEEIPSVGSPRPETDPDWHRRRLHKVELTRNGKGQRIWRCWGAPGHAGICAEGEV